MMEFIATATKPSVVQDSGDCYFSINREAENP